MPDKGQDEFTFYINQYLQVLQTAGICHFFCHPILDEDEEEPCYDFSLMSKSLPILESLHGIKVEKINAYLSWLWQKASKLAATTNDVDNSKSAQRLLYLAEYRSYWSPSQRRSSAHELQFHLKFGCPRVSVVCSCEVIMWFSIEEVLLYDSNDFSASVLRIILQNLTFIRAYVIPSPPLRQYSGWQIPMLITTTQIVLTEDEQTANAIKLDTSSTTSCGTVEFGLTLIDI